MQGLYQMQDQMNLGFILQSGDSDMSSKAASKMAKRVAKLFIATWE